MEKPADDEAYQGQEQVWTWEVETTAEEGAIASFRVQLDFELVSGNEIERVPDHWKDSPVIKVDVGLPNLIKVLAPLSSGAGILGIVGGTLPLRRRRKEGEDGEESLNEVPDGTESSSDEVHSAVYAPPRAKTGSSFLVQVFAYLPEQEAEIENIATARNRDAQQQDSIILDEEIERGTKLTFDFRMPELKIDEPVQSLTWKGNLSKIRYIVSVPPDYPLGECFGRVIVSKDSVPIGRMDVTVDIAAVSAAETEEAKPTGGKIKYYESAFISYASKDRPEVLKRVQMLNAEKIPSFMDMITLEPGDRWERELYKNIDKCDVVYVFWSEAAKRSKWIQKEIIYAYRLQNGKDTAPPDIIPIPIEGPPPIKPPKVLSFLHFNDKFIYLIYAAEAEKKANEE